jgi:SAM-dependent methyltransferase
MPDRSTQTRTTPSPLRPTETEALAEWRRLVQADAEQVMRLREQGPEPDHYTRLAPRFRPGSGLEAPELPLLEALAEPEDTWLDIGAGGGRFAVPLARRVRRLIALEPSEAMRGTLAEAARANGTTNIVVHDLRWPADAWTEAVDVSLAAHVVYDIAELSGFLDAMERHTRRLCVAVLADRGRGASLASVWQAVHDEPLAELPALREFVAVLGSRGRRYEVRTVPLAVPAPAEPEEAFELARRLCWLAPGSAKDEHLRALLQAQYAAPNARIALPPARRFIGIVTWVPPSG